MRYTLTIRFDTDRPLTADEQRLLMAACQAQVDEPADVDGNDIDVTVTNSESRIAWPPYGETRT